MKTKDLPLELLPFEDFGEPLLKLVQAIAKPEPPKGAPPIPPTKTDTEPEDSPITAATADKPAGKKIALLSANPLNDEQNWKSCCDELKKIPCQIYHFSLSRDNLNNLDGYDYVMICSKVIKNKLLIENDYLCSERISFQELESNIGNEKTAGLFIFVDHLPEEKFTEELSLPTFILPYQEKSFKEMKFHLFKKNNLSYFQSARILNPSLFMLQPLAGMSGIHPRKPTYLSESIDTANLKNFIGRRDDLEQICRKLVELEEGCVLTVKGAGGIGKTHTVKKIAAALAERGRFTGGIYFIDCEPVTDSRQFQFKAAAVFGLEHAEDAWQHLREHHDGNDRLIIFDNFETLLYLDEREEIKNILGKTANYAKVLITSRELLHIEGETEWPIRPMTTDEAAAFFESRFSVAKQEKELLRQEILDPLLNNNPLAIKIITDILPKGKSLAKLKEDLEKNRLKTIDSDLQIFDSGSDTNIDRKKSMYACILYSYNLLSRDEKIAFELLSLFPDGINLEEFKKLTNKSEDKKKMPPLLITDPLVKSLDDKSMIENNGGHIKHQSIVGKFAEVKLEERKRTDDIELLYKNAFFYNYRLSSILYSISKTEAKTFALEGFSGQQENFLAAIKYCDQFNAKKEKLLNYLDNLLSLFINICSLNGFIRDLSGKIDIFDEKEKRCAEAILLQSEYFNGYFSKSFAKIQRLLPIEEIDALNIEIFAEELLYRRARNVYEMEGAALWAAKYSAQNHSLGFHYQGCLLWIGEYNTKLAEVCQDDFFTFEALANLGLLDVKRIDSYFAGLHEKNHLERMQASYTRAKLRPLERRKIEPLVSVNPYTRGLKKLMLAFIEEDAEKADALYKEAAEHLWHIRYYHVEALYFHAAFLHQHHVDDFDAVYQRGLELAKQHHYRFLQYRFEELANPTGLVYDQRNYPLPDNQDFSEYINFLIKQNKERHEGKGRIGVRRR